MSSDESLMVLPGIPDGWPGGTSATNVANRAGELYRQSDRGGLSDFGSDLSWALRAAQVQVGGANREPEVDMNLSDEEPASNDEGRVPTPRDDGQGEEEEEPDVELVRRSKPKRRHKHKSKSPKKKKRRGGSARVATDDDDESVRETEGKREEEDGESVLYDDDFDVDHPALMGLLANEEVAKVHNSVSFTRHLQIVEQQSLQHAAFLKYIRGTVVPHFQDVRSNNEALEGEVSGLKASVELVGKELKSYKTSNEQLKTAKETAEKSLTTARNELKKAREDLALRTTKVEAAKKEVLDLRAEKESLEKAGASGSGMSKQAVAALVKKNLVRHQAKWDEEKAKLVAIDNSLVKDSFENAMAQLSIRNPGLVWDGVSHEFEVFRGQVCKVDTSARKLVDVDSGVELADWDGEGKYRDGEE
ncbi:putative flagellar attachment zone protein 1-like [Sesbania bispinosa]|nr:putative flagellar attachment zone protein 1-like [Sesbania bispinosa]